MSNNDFKDAALERLEETRDAGAPGAIGERQNDLTKSAENDSSATGRGEGVGQAKETEGLSQGQIVMRRFFRHSGALLGMIVLALILLLALTSMGIQIGSLKIPGWWHDQDWLATHDVLNDGAPTKTYPFGQDTIGRDNFSLVMKGVQTSFTIMIVMSAIAGLIGVTIGALSGYYRGWVDMVLMRFTDLVITLPAIVVGAVLGRMISSIPDKMGMSAIDKNKIYNNLPALLAVALGLVVWTTLARLTRSEFLSLREREFVDSARVAGASDFRIITKHILPNALGVIIVNLSLLMSLSVVTETALSFLGFGVKEPNVSLGNLISTYQSAFATRPWLFWWPGLFIILIALCINFIGDGLRDAFDPRTRKMPSVRQMNKADAQLAAAGLLPAAGATAAAPSATTTSTGATAVAAPAARDGGATAVGDQASERSNGATAQGEK